MMNAGRTLSLILSFCFLFPPGMHYPNPPTHLAPVSNLSELAVTPDPNGNQAGITAPTLQDGYIQQGFFSRLDLIFEESYKPSDFIFNERHDLMDPAHFSEKIRRILLDAKNSVLIEEKIGREAVKKLAQIVEAQFRDPNEWKIKMRDIDSSEMSQDERNEIKRRECPADFLRFNAFVHSENDFILGKYNPNEKRLYLAEDFIQFLEKRGPSTLIDEYLVHEVLCGVVGYYPAIALQQKLFPAHYQDGNFVEEGGLKYLPGHPRDSNKPYKGALREAIQEFIQIKKSHCVEFPSQTDKILFYCKKLENYLENILRVQHRCAGYNSPEEALQAAIFGRRHANPLEIKREKKIIEAQWELLSSQMDLLRQFFSNKSVQEGLFKLTGEEIFEIMAWELMKVHLENRPYKIALVFTTIKIFVLREQRCDPIVALPIAPIAPVPFYEPLYELLLCRASIAQRKKMGEDHLRTLEGKELQLITGDNITLHSWAENLLDQQPSVYWHFIQRLNFDDKGNELSCIKSLFGSGLKKEEQQAISKRIFEKLNKGEFSQEELQLLGEKYDVYVEPFVRRIGLIQREDIAFEIYKKLFTPYKESAEKYRRVTDGERMMDDEGHFTHEDRETASERRAAERRVLETFYLYNPSKELLKAAIHLMSQELSPGAPTYKRKKSALRPGTRIPLLSDREVNALGWLINNSPKNDKTRDQRRWLHKFILDLVERRIQREEDEVSLLMSALLVDMKTNEPLREKNVATVLAFLHFSLFFGTLSKELQRKVYKKLHEKVEEWGSLEPVTGVKKKGRKKEKKKKAPRKKFYLAAQHYQELKQILMETLLDNIYVSSQTLTPSEKQMLREHVRKYQEAWQDDGFLILMIRYHHFQDKEGKAVVEKFLKMLSQSEVRDGHFMNLPRYNWAEPGLQEWFGKPLIEKFQKGAEVPYAEERNGTNLKSRFSDIWHDILVHLGIHEVEEENWREELEAKWKSSQSDLQEFENFWNLFGEIQQALERGEKIEPPKIQGWKKQWNEWQMERKIHGAGEVLVNLDQIAVVQQMEAKQLGMLRFVVTEDPVEFIRSGERPYYTCQRCVEPTGQNGHGTPVNRPRQGHFLLAQVRDSEGEVLARSLLARLSLFGTNFVVSACKIVQKSERSSPQTLFSDSFF